MATSAPVSGKKLLIIFCLALLSLGGCKKNTKGVKNAFQHDSNFSSFSGGRGSSARPGSSQDFSVNVGDRIFFDTDSTSINADAEGILFRQAQWLNRYRSYRVMIEGHADERGTREYNLALGARRAASVRDFLVENGVESDRLKTISYGKERPVSVCDDISCWSQNRRAVTTISGAIR